MKMNTMNTANIYKKYKCKLYLISISDGKFSFDLILFFFPVSCFVKHGSICGNTAFKFCSLSVFFFFGESPSSVYLPCVCVGIVVEKKKQLRDNPKF